MELDQPLDNRQSQPGAAFAAGAWLDGSTEGLEQVREEFGRDSNSRVAHAHDDRAGQRGVGGDLQLDGPPLGVNLMALVNRLVKTRWSL